MKNLLSYLKNPIPPNDKVFKFQETRPNMIVVLKLLLVTITISIVIGFFCSLLDNLLVSLLKIDSIIKPRTDNFNAIFRFFGKYKFLYTVLLGPLLEELLFRLPLKPKEIFISFSLCFFCYKLCGFDFIHFDFHLIDSYIIFSIFFLLTPFLFILLLKKINLVAIIERNYKLYFYSLAALFSLIHIINFEPLNLKVFYLYPFFVLPQFVMGLTLGYARNKLGLPYSCLLHSLINLPLGFF